MKQILSTILLGLMFTSINTADLFAKETVNSGSQCSGEINIEVNGLVCDFCARALEKLFKKEDAVKAIEVNMEKGLVTITTKSGQKLERQHIEKLIVDSGYNINNIKSGCTE